MTEGKMTLGLSKHEMAALKGISERKRISKEDVIRQALYVYAAVDDRLPGLKVDFSESR